VTVVADEGDGFGSDLLQGVDSESLQERLYVLIDELGRVNKVRTAAHIHSYVSGVDDCSVFFTGCPGSEGDAVLLSAFYELAGVPWFNTQVSEEYYLVRVGFDGDNWSPRSVAEELQEYYNERRGRVNRSYRYETWESSQHIWFAADLYAEYVGDVRSLKFHGYAEVKAGGEWVLKQEEESFLPDAVEL